MMTTPDGLLPTLAILRAASTVSIILTMMANYKAKYGQYPTLIRVNVSLRMAVTSELINKLNIAPDCAVAEPFWIDGIPLVYVRDLGEYYIEMRDTKRGIQYIF